jgi:hypothetical protein
MRRLVYVGLIAAGLVTAFNANKWFGDRARAANKGGLLLL